MKYKIVIHIYSPNNRNILINLLHCEEHFMIIKAVNKIKYRASILSEYHKKMIERGDIEMALNFFNFNAIQKPNDINDNYWLNLKATVISDEWRAGGVEGISKKDILKYIQ